MTTFKQFLAEVIDLPLFAKLIDRAANRTPALLLHCDYDGHLHEGFVDGARVNNDWSIWVDYRGWRTEDDGAMYATYEPMTMAIYEEDVDRFYIGDFLDAEGNKRKALMCRPK